MQTKITIRNEAQTCYIDIEGTIGVDEKHQFEQGEKRVPPSRPSVVRLSASQAWRPHTWS